MVGLLGIAAAGAVQGARNVSNEETQNQREALRQKYEHQYKDAEYARNRKDQIEDREASDRTEGERYERNLKDKREGEAADRDFRAGESAKNRAHQRGLANAKGGGTGGGEDSKSGIRSTLGKQISDLMDQNLADTPKQALDILDQRGLIKGIAANQFIDDPQQVFDLFEDIKKGRQRSRKKEANPQDTYLNFDPTQGFVD